MIFMWILIGIFIWTIISIGYALSQIHRMFEVTPPKTPWYEYFLYPPLFLIAITLEAWHKIKKK